MPGNIEKLLREYRDTIEKGAEEHIQKMILYGSYARGDFREDSDIDIMILLDLDENSSQLKFYEDRIYDVTYDFNWEHDTEIMPVVKSIQQFEYWKKVYLFYRNVEKEGVLI